MVSNYTANYHLNQWEPEDQVRRIDFNADNVKLDAALTKKADASELAALRSAVDQKAEQSALEELGQKVSGQGAKLEALNCQVYWGTYRGDGMCIRDEGYEGQTITFPGTPLAVIIVGDSKTLVMVDGPGSTLTSILSGGVTNIYYMRNNSVTWYSTDGSAANMMNAGGYPYGVVALLKVE